MTINEAMSICFKEGVEVYPMRINGEWKIEVKKQGQKPTQYKKSVEAGSKTSLAIAKTYLYLAKKIIEK